MADCSRTVQFLIERPPCYQARLDITKLLPISIWVYWPIMPPRKLEGVSHSCNGWSWEVTTESAEDIRRQFNMSLRTGRFWVCEHMGHIIE